MRDSVVATVIAVVAGISGWSLRGAREIPAPQSPAPVRAPRVVAPPAAPIPALRVAAVHLPHATNSRRNLFAYVTAPVIPAPPPAPVVAVAPPAPVVTSAPIVSAPPVPQFSYRYIGRFGPAHKSIAAFTRDGDVVTARTGAVIDGRFVLRAIHNDAVDVETTVGSEVHALRVPIGR
jgi:hypothetical protein